MAAASDLIGLLILSMAVGASALTVTKSSLFAPVRARVARVPLLGKLLSCPWCLSHWLALAAVLAVGVTDPVRVVVGTFATVAGAGLVVGLVMRALWFHEQEVERLRKRTAELDTLLARATEEVEALTTLGNPAADALQAMVAAMGGHPPEWLQAEYDLACEVLEQTRG